MTAYPPLITLTYIGRSNCDTRVNIKKYEVCTFDPKSPPIAIDLVDPNAVTTLGAILERATRRAAEIILFNC